MRNGRDVLDVSNFDAGAGERADGRFAAGARTGDSNFNGPQARFLRLVGGRQRGLLGGERSTFARTAEAERSRTRPGERVPHRVTERDDGVVERCLNVAQPDRDVLLLFFLKILLFGSYFCLCFIHCRSRNALSSHPALFDAALLLVSYRTLARTLARAGVGVGALAAGRQATAMPQTAIGAHLH